MGLLVLGGREVAEATVQAGVVVPLDPAGGGELDFGGRLEGPRVEDRGADALGLEQPDDALPQCVIVRVADAADRGQDALQGRCSVNARWCTGPVQPVDATPYGSRERS